MKTRKGTVAEKTKKRTLHRGAKQRLKLSVPELAAIFRALRANRLAKGIRIPSRS